MFMNGRYDGYSCYVESVSWSGSSFSFPYPYSRHRCLHQSRLRPHGGRRCWLKLVPVEIFVINTCRGSDNIRYRPRVSNIRLFVCYWHIRNNGLLSHLYHWCWALWFSILLHHKQLELWLIFRFWCPIVFITQVIMLMIFFLFSLIFMLFKLFF